MFSAEIRKLLLEVITSWQIIAVSVVLVIYILIINNVARIYHSGPRRSRRRKARKKDIPAAPGPSDGDELGLDDDKKEK